MTPENHAPDSQPSEISEPAPLVLIVDDSRVMRVALSRLLSKRYQVLEAEDGEQGWQTIQNNPAIELVFSDLSMPEVDGFELLRRVRASEDQSVSGLPFVVITGHEDDEGMQRKAAGMGASDFVSKPFRSAEITTRAKTLIGQRRAVRRLHTELQSRATRDAVTGLSDAAHFAAHFGELLALAQRHGLNSACLLVQIDDFGSWAEARPEAQRHALLRHLAEQLQAACRAEDGVGYLGDGSYAVALSGATDEGARLLAQRLMARLEENPPEPLPALSHGVSTPPGAHTSNAAELLAAARRALAPLRRQAPPAPAADDEPSSDIASVLSKVESVLSATSQSSESASLRHELEEARAALAAAQQQNTRLGEQVDTLKQAAREQVAKAHRELATARSQVAAVQAQFRDYMQENPREGREQAARELAELRAVLVERDEQLASEQELRRQAQEMVQQLQSRIAEAAAQAEAAAASRGKLFGRLRRRS